MLTHDTPTHPGILIASPSTSPLYCPWCGEFFSHLEGAMLAQHAKVACSCGRFVYGATGCRVAMRAQDAHLLDEDAVLQATWFHISTRQDWAKDITEPVLFKDDLGLMKESTLMVHVGGREAAKDRSRLLSAVSTGDESFFLYEVRLKPGTEVSSLISEDEGASWPTAFDQCGTVVRGKNYEQFIPGANRYVNAYEGHGSISLMVGAHTIEVVSGVKVNPKSLLPI